MKDPPDLPNGLQITSMAALPLVFDSLGKGDEVMIVKVAY